MATIIVARVLGTSEFGELGIIQSTIAMFGTFAGMGLGVTSTRYIAEYKITDPARVGRVIALTSMVSWCSAIFLALLLISLAPWLALNMLANPGLREGLQLAAPLLVFSAFTGAQGGALAGFEAFRVMARIGVIQGLITFPLIIGGVFFWGVGGAITGLGVSSFVGYLLNRRAIKVLVGRAGITSVYREGWLEHDILTQTAIPALLTGVMVGPVIWLGNTVIVNEADGYTQLGIFNAVNQWKILLAYLPTVIGNVLLPMLSSESKKSNAKLEEFNFFGNWLIVTFFGIIFMAYPEILSMLYGSSYIGEDFNKCLAIMMMVSIVLAFKEGIARKLVVGGLLWWGVLSNLLWSVLFIACVVFWKKMGGTGLAYAYLVSYVINTLIFVPFYLKKNVISMQFIFSIKGGVLWTSTLLIMSSTLLSIGIVYKTLLVVASLSTYVVIIFNMIKRTSSDIARV